MHREIFRIGHRNWGRKAVASPNDRYAFVGLRAAKAEKFGTSVLLYLTEGKRQVSNWRLWWLKSPFIKASKKNPKWRLPLITKIFSFIIHQREYTVR
jgi:hypothetical protein